MITNTKFYKENKEEIVAGLVVGLVAGLGASLGVGLGVGLVWSLVAGLAWGLAWGLVWGLVAGLVVGLVAGLVVILINWSEAFPFLTGLPEIAFLILGILILVELFYWLDSEKPKGKVKTSFVLKKKFEAFLEVLLPLSAIAQVYILAREFWKPEYINEVLKWIGYIGEWILGLAIISGIIWIWLELNKLKYKK